MIFSGANANRAVRPAFNLDLDSVLFISAAEDGKSVSNEDSGEIIEISDYSGNEWKLTLLDRDRNFAITEQSASGKSGDTVTLNYTGATTGTNEYISAIIADNSGAQYYGRITDTNAESGTVSIKIPDTLSDGIYTLAVFSEQYNGGENDDTKLTDYASAFAEVSLTVSSDTTAPILSDGIATRDSETDATVTFTSDETGEYYYEVVESGAAEPNIDTNKSGTSCTIGENKLSLDNLSGTGAKDIYIVAKDAIGNVSQRLKITIPAIYNLTVKLNGGNGSTADGNYIAGYEIEIDAGERSGYRFTGWTSSNGGYFDDASSAKTTFTMPANDITITANWKKRSTSSGGSSPSHYFITFDTNGGEDMDKLLNEEYTKIDLDDYVPEREGYKFVGWYADKDLTEKIDEIYLTKNTTIYAKWEKIDEEVPKEPDETEGIIGAETVYFKDVKYSDWFYDAVSYAIENGLMSGMGDEMFSPNTPLQREMFAMILWNLEGNPKPRDVAPFLDVTSDKYYAEAIAWASENGIVSGFGETFGVGESITREQLAVMLYNYAQYKGYDISAGEDTNILSYTDAIDISDYAYPAMQWACGAGIINGMGDGTLAPQGQTTRAETVTMLKNFCENAVK